MASKTEHILAAGRMRGKPILLMNANPAQSDALASDCGKPNRCEHVVGDTGLHN